MQLKRNIGAKLTIQLGKL